MRVPWKIIGAAGIAGVAASGVVVVRRRRAQTEVAPDELRERLHRRLAEVSPQGSEQPGPSPAPGDPPAPR